MKVIKQTILRSSLRRIHTHSSKCVRKDSNTHKHDWAFNEIILSYLDKLQKQYMFI